MDTDQDFKEMTGTGLDEVDIAGIVEVDDEEPVVADDSAIAADPLDDGSLVEETEQDEMLDYIYGEELNSR